MPLESGTIAGAMTLDLIDRTDRLGEQEVLPHLAIIEGIGHTSLSGEVNAYVQGKQKVAMGVGVETGHVRVPTVELEEWIAMMNDQPYTDAIIVEEPLPGCSRAETAVILGMLDDNKAVDNQGPNRLWGMGATSEATVTLLDWHGHTGEGRHVLIVGDGKVGGPLANVYNSPERKVKDLSVVNIHNREKLPALALAADMVIVATGSPNTLTPDMVRKEHVIVGVGARDIHPDVRALTHTPFWVTPAKGGVGPLTIRTLLGRVVDLAEGKPPRHPFATQLAESMQ